MTDRAVLIIVILWILCGILADGMLVGYFQASPGHGSVRSDVCFGLFPAIGGPLGLFAAVITTGAGENGICFTETGCAELRRKRDKR